MVATWGGKHGIQNVPDIDRYLRYYHFRNLHRTGESLMVKVKCPKHETEHVFKPTDVSQLLTYYMNELVIVGYQEPLPQIDALSNPSTLWRAMCPQEDLVKIKRARDVERDSRFSPTLSKTWQREFLRNPPPDAAL